MKKRLLSIIISAALVISMTAAAFASEYQLPSETVSENESTSSPVELQAVASKLQSTAAQLESMSPGEDYVDGEGVFIADTREEAEQRAKEYGGTLKSYSHRVAVISFPASTIDTFKMTASRLSAEEYVDPQYINHLMDAPSTPFDGAGNSSKPDDLYASKDIEHYQYFHDKVNTLAAHEITTGKGAKIAVIDTGCCPDHEDSPFDEKHALMISTFNSPSDNAVGHGIHCTGIIHGTKNNKLGGYGIAPDAEIYSIKVSDGLGIKQSETDEAISMAMELKVNVISMSLGGGTTCESEARLVEEAYEKGILIVAAAGNNSEYALSYPAAHAHVISVAASDRKDNLANYSNYGSWVDVAAPGDLITSTYIYIESETGNKNSAYYPEYLAGTKPQDAYGCISGTSMAAPVVAGIAALCYSANPKLLELGNHEAVDLVTRAILDNTDGKDYVYDGQDEYGVHIHHSVNGLVQADRAVAAAESLTIAAGKHTLVDESGYFGTYLRGNLAQGKKVKLFIGDPEGKTGDKSLKKAAKTAKWESSDPGVTVKNGIIKCAKSVAIGSKVNITAELDGEKLQCVYTVTKPIVAAGISAGDKMVSKLDNKARPFNTGSYIDLRTPVRNVPLLMLVYNQNPSDDEIATGDFYYIADNTFRYKVTVKDKYIKNGSITLSKSVSGIPIGAVLNNPGTYSFKFKTIDGSNKGFTFNITVK